MTETPTTNPRVTSSGRVAIVAKYHGPTNTRGSRIIAKRADHQTGDKRYTHHWDHALNSSENYVAAVRGLVVAYGWAGTWVVGSGRDGYYAVSVPTVMDRAVDAHRGDHSIVVVFDRPVERDDAWREHVAPWVAEDVSD